MPTALEVDSILFVTQV